MAEEHVSEVEYRSIKIYNNKELRKQWSVEQYQSHTLSQNKWK